MPLHSTEKVVKNTIIYTAATVAQKAISFIYFWTLSANLRPAELGAYLSMLALASLFSIGMDLGLTPLLTREAAQHEEQSSKLLRATYAIKLPLVFLTTLLLWLAAILFFDLLAAEKLLLLGATLIVAIDAFTAGAYAILRARQNIVIESRAILIFQSTVMTGGLLALFLTRNIVFIMAALLLGSMVNAVYTIGSARRIVGEKITPAFDRPRMRHLTARLPAFAAAGIFTKIYQQADVVLLRLLASTHAVGLYSIPAKITTALQTLIPGAFSAAIYPTMSNFARVDRARLAALFSYTFGSLFLLALPLGLFLAMLTPTILATVWPQYLPVAPAMRLMLLAVPFLFLPYATSSLLNAVGREKRNSLNRAAMTAINVGANLLLIPFYREFGAAIAFFSANALLLILDLAAVRREFALWNADIRRLTIGSVVSCLPALIAAWLVLGFVQSRAIGQQGLLAFVELNVISFGAAMIIYVIFLALTRTIRRADVAALRQMIKPKTAGL
ncbi:polysaccharide biosynthesis protein [Patescibacteria group bacterium]|nr:MAG: polysaccharide biosynthesis protein [Patescibacteria group bacterium]